MGYWLQKLSTVWPQRSCRGHWGQKGQKLKNATSSYRLQGMVTWLMDMHQLDPLYKSYHFKNSPGSFGVTGVKRSFSLKMLYLVYVTWHDQKTHTCASVGNPLPILWGYISIWGHLGSLGSKGHFHWKCYNSSMLHSMTIRLIYVHYLETLYLFFGVKGQNVSYFQNIQNATAPTDYVAW